MCMCASVFSLILSSFIYVHNVCALVNLHIFDMLICLGTSTDTTTFSQLVLLFRERTMQKKEAAAANKHSAKVQQNN